MRMRTLIIFLAMSFGLFAQTSPEVTPSLAPSNTPYTYVAFKMSGIDNIEYICRALSKQPSFSWLKDEGSLVDIVVSGGVATVNFSSPHGLSVENAIRVFGSSTPSLNGQYKVISLAGNSVSFPTLAPDAVYTESGLGAATEAPRLNANIWSVQKFFYIRYGVSSILSRISWADGSTSSGKSCEDRTSYAYN
jgi:hypothetical protein